MKSNQWTEDVIPTVAFNLRKVRKGNVTMRIWDVAGTYLALRRFNKAHDQTLNHHDTWNRYDLGQPKFRSMWERYCKGNDAIVYVIIILPILLLEYAHLHVENVGLNSFVVDSTDVCAHSLPFS